MLAPEAWRRLGHEHEADALKAESKPAGTRHIPSSGAELVDVGVLDQVFADGRTSLAVPFTDGAVLRP